VVLGNVGTADDVRRARSRAGARRAARARARGLGAGPDRLADAAGALRDRATSESDPAVLGEIASALRGLEG
jgi:hypothetical protein